MKATCFCVYIIESCKDGTLYTGTAAYPKKRLEQHNAGKGAKYTRGRGPWCLLGFFVYDSVGVALRVERQVKKLSREKKLQWIAGNLPRYSWDP